MILFKKGEVVEKHFKFYFSLLNYEVDFEWIGSNELQYIDSENWSQISTKYTCSGESGNDWSKRKLNENKKNKKNECRNSDCGTII